MTNTKLLRETIKDSGLKLQAIADKLGISRFSLQLKIDNRFQFKSEEIQELCKILEITSLQEKEDIFFANEVDC